MRISPIRVHQRLIDKNLSDIYTRFGRIFTTQTPSAGAAGDKLTINADVVFGGGISTEGGDGAGSLARGNVAWDIAGNLTVKGNITSGSTITGATIVGGTIETATAGQRLVLDGAANRLYFYSAGGVEVMRVGEAVFAGKAGLKVTGGTLYTTTNDGISVTSIYTNVDSLALYAYADTTTLRGTDTIAMRAAASASVADRTIGLYASATNSGGGEALAGLFDGNVKVNGTLSGTTVIATNASRTIYTPTIVAGGDNTSVGSEITFAQVGNFNTYYEKIRTYDVKRAGDKYVTINWIDSVSGNTQPPVLRLDVNGTTVNTNCAYGDSNQPRSAQLDISALADGTPLTIKMWMQSNYSTTTFNVAHVVIAVSAA